MPTEPQRLNARPQNLEGDWLEEPTDQHGYRHFTAGPVVVRGFDGPKGFEPDGELVTREPVQVHMERMDKGHWWIGLDLSDGGRVAIDLSSKTSIAVRWRDER